MADAFDFPCPEFYCLGCAVVLVGVAIGAGVVILALAVFWSLYMIAPSSIVIHDGNYQNHLQPPPGFSKGLVPRDFTQHPVGFLGVLSEPFPDSMLIPEDEIDQRIQEEEAAQSSIQHIMMRGNNGQPIPALDQNQKGYCWAHSTTSCVMAARAIAGLPYVPMSAYMVACLIKGYRDEGGWNAESLAFIAKNGVPSDKFWAMKSMARANDTPEMRANAMKHRITGWWDLSDDAEKAFHQVATCCLLKIPCATDFNWWGHSVMTGRVLAYKSPKSRILNSWASSWGDHGWGDIEGQKCYPNGASAVRVTEFSVE